MNRQAIKANARAQIKGNIGMLFLITLLVSLIASAIAAIPVVGTVASFLVFSPAFSLAMTLIYLRLYAGVRPELSHAFDSFNQFWPAFKVTFFVGLFTGLWSLLFVIPGIVKGYAYSQAMYILADNPDIGALEALRRSEEMMKGHKMERFVLDLSFIGWILLVSVTCGIAGIYVAPYMSAASANFYRALQAGQTQA